MDVCLAEWDLVSAIKGNQAQMMHVESLCHKTKENPSPKYDFDSRFYTFLENCTFLSTCISEAWMPKIVFKKV
jgi:hypothetical protein